MPNANTADHYGTHALMGYVADLELEVDRLRKQSHFVQQQTRATLLRIHSLCANGADAGDARDVPAKIDEAAKALAEVLRDLRELPGYHPAHDQVIAIAVRPLVDQVYRWQQRLEGGASVQLRLELDSDYVEWFPARLRHILDNLLSNCLKYRDPVKSESWVQLALRSSPEGYEFRVSDNGVGMASEQQRRVFELLHRATPARAANLGVGLAVAKLLVEQSGGSLTAQSGEGMGSTFVVVLPRYDVDDFLT